MQSSLNNRKSLIQANQILELTHFAICPYLIQIPQKLNYIFTVNFQKDCQIIGQLSTLIYPEINIKKFQLQAEKNIFLFRILKDKKINYKWCLYKRNQNGKQEIVQTVKINLQQTIDDFILQQKKNRWSFMKSKIYDPKILNTSFKQNQSVLRTTQKSFIRKSLVQTQKHISKIKVFKANFLNTGIILTYLLCLTSTQQEIFDSVTEFHMNQKLDLASKAFILGQQTLSPQIFYSQKRNKLQTIVEQDIAQKVNKQKKTLITFSEKGQLKNKIQYQSQKNGQNHTKLKINDKQKRDNLHRDDNNLSITRSHRNISQGSNLRLDDIILNGKRISISDKSEWLKTSKSKTQDLLDISQKGKSQRKVKKVSYSKLNEQFHSQSLQVTSKQHNEKTNLLQQNQQSQQQRKTYDPSKNNIYHKSVLKRKSTIQGTSHNIDKNDSKNNFYSIKPKTLDQKKLNKIFQSQGDRNYHNQKVRINKRPFLDSVQSNIDYENQIIKVKKQINIQNSEKKYITSILPEVIPQEFQMGRSGQIQCLNKQFSAFQNQSSMDWGHGISEISEINPNKSTPYQLSLSWMSQKLQFVQNNYFNSYIQKVFQKIQSYQLGRLVFIPNFKSYISFKNCCIFLLFTLFLLTMQILGPQQKFLNRYRIRDKDFFTKRPKNSQKKSKTRKGKR